MKMNRKNLVTGVVCTMLMMAGSTAAFASSEEGLLTNTNTETQTIKAVKAVTAKRLSAEDLKDIEGVKLTVANSVDLQSVQLIEGDFLEMSPLVPSLNIMDITKIDKGNFRIITLPAETIQVQSTK